MGVNLLAHRGQPTLQMEHNCLDCQWVSGFMFHSAAGCKSSFTVSLRSCTELNRTEGEHGLAGSPLVLCADQWRFQLVLAIPKTGPSASVKKNNSQ